MIKWKKPTVEPKLNRNSWKSGELLIEASGGFVIGYYSVYLGYLTRDSKRIAGVTRYVEIN